MGSVLNRGVFNGAVLHRRAFNRAVNFKHNLEHSIHYILEISNAVPRDKVLAEAIDKM